VVAKSISGILSNFKLSVALSNFDVFLDLLVKVSVATLGNLTFGQLGTTGCVASSVDTFSFQSLIFNLSRASITLEDAQLQLNVTDAVIRVLDALTRQSKVLLTLLHGKIDISYIP
jgi:hypothetical protein